MKDSWFTPLGWVYYPVSWQGFLIAILVALFCIQVFVAVDTRSHSVSDTLYGIFPYWAGAVGIYLWIATKSSFDDS